jgi:hypothetical protein
MDMTHGTVHRQAVSIFDAPPPQPPEPPPVQRRRGGFGPPPGTGFTSMTLSASRAEPDEED